MINSKAVKRWEELQRNLTEYDPEYWEHPAERLEDAIYDVGAKLILKKYYSGGSVIVKWEEDGKVYKYISYWPAHSDQYTIREERTSSPCGRERR